MPFIKTTKPMESHRIILERNTWKLTPVSNPQSLLVSSIKHGANNQETGRYRTFAHTQDQADNEEPCKILAGCVCTKGDCPYQNVKADDNKKLKHIYELTSRNCYMYAYIPHPFSDGKMLETEILGKLESQITQVENCTEPSNQGDVNLNDGS